VLPARFTPIPLKEAMPLDAERVVVPEREALPDGVLGTAVEQVLSEYKARVMEAELVEMRFPFASSTRTTGCWLSVPPAVPVEEGSVANVT
jgi:hypothetical protein